MSDTNEMLREYRPGWQTFKTRRFESIGKQHDLDARMCFLSSPGEFGYLQAPVMAFIRDHDRFENGRILIVVNRRKDDDFKPILIISDDFGKTWDHRYLHRDESGAPDLGWCQCIAYLGGGRLIMHYTNYYTKKPDEKERSYILASGDCGDSWEIAADFPPEDDGREFYLWGEGMYVDLDPETGRDIRIFALGYSQSTISFEDGGRSLAGIRFSYDSGLTWSKTYLVPEWYGYNEVVITKAANGDLIAALRKDAPKRFGMSYFDNFSGMGISFSTDGGASWSEVADMYEWGRHFPCMVLLPCGDIVMTYIVRIGYPVTPEGYPQFGVEAIVSRDNGRTWDYDNRYILMDWEGSISGPLSWLSGCQGTSTSLMPNGSLLTVFGSGARSSPDPDKPVWGCQMDTVLINWRLDSRPPESECGIMSMASPYSDIRNMAENMPGSGSLEKWLAANKNIAVSAYGTSVHSSSSDAFPSNVLYNRFYRNFLTLETIPAWIELEWPEEHMIDEVRIHAGAPQLWNEPQTECVPLDYKLYYWKDGWNLLVPPVTDSKRYDGSVYFLISKNEFDYRHKFSQVRTRKIRMEITRSSDTGKRKRTGDMVVVPENKRKTVIRLIEVMAI